MTARSRAKPNPEISNKLPIKASVINNVQALITNKNSPKVNNVTGKVKRMRMGRTSIFNIDRIMLAPMADHILDTSTPSKYPAKARNKRAFTKIPILHLILLTFFFANIDRACLRVRHQMNGFGTCTCPFEFHLFLDNFILFMHDVNII